MFWCSSCCSGRYNKFCRSLPQTPWVIDGERRMESSVEELIAAPVLSSFRSDGESTLWRSQHFVERDNKLTLNLFWWSDAGFNFSSSGREDVDVRTLGNGEDAYKYFFYLFKSALSLWRLECVYSLFHRLRQVVRSRWSCWILTDPDWAERRWSSCRRSAVVHSQHWRLWKHSVAFYSPVWSLRSTSCSNANTYPQSPPNYCLLILN